MSLSFNVWPSESGRNAGLAMNVDNGCCCRTQIHLLRVALFESRLVNPALLSQTARGPGPLGKMFSATLAIANAGECHTVQCV